MAPIGKPGDPLPVVVCAATDPDLLALVRRFCSTLPCVIRTTDNGEEALRCLGSEPVSLAMAEQRLKTMSGTRFLQEVSRRSPTTIRILLTTVVDPPDPMEPEEERIHAVISKPWDGPALRRTILAILQWQEERRRMKC